MRYALQASKGLFAEIGTAVGATSTVAVGGTAVGASTTRVGGVPPASPSWRGSPASSEPAPTTAIAPIKMPNTRAIRKRTMEALCGTLFKLQKDYSPRSEPLSERPVPSRLVAPLSALRRPESVGCHLPAPVGGEVRLAPSPPLRLRSRQSKCRIPGRSGSAPWRHYAVRSSSFKRIIRRDRNRCRSDQYRRGWWHRCRRFDDPSRWGATCQPQLAGKSG